MAAPVANQTTPWETIANCLNGSLTVEEVREQMPTTIAYWLDKGQSRLVSKKLHDDSARTQIIEEFVQKYQESNGNSANFAYTMMNTRLFRKLGKHGNSESISRNIDFLTTISAKSYVKSSFPELADNVHVLAFISKIFAVTAEPSAFDKQREIIASGSYVPTEGEIRDYKVKLNLKDAEPFFEWRATKSREVATKATAGELKRSHIAQLIVGLDSRNVPLDECDQVPPGYAGQYIEYFSAEPYRASFNLLREGLIAGYKMFIDSPLVQNDMVEKAATV